MTNIILTTFTVFMMGLGAGIVVRRLKQWWERRAAAKLALEPSIGGIATVHGKFFIYGDALLSYYTSSPDCEYFKETYHPVFRAWKCSIKMRGHDEVTYIYSKEDAQKDGRWETPGPWSIGWKRLLQANARRGVIRELERGNVL